MSTAPDEGVSSQKISISMRAAIFRKWGVFGSKTPFSGVVGFVTRRPSFPDVGEFDLDSQVLAVFGSVVGDAWALSGAWVPLSPHVSPGVQRPLRLHILLQLLFKISLFHTLLLGFVESSCSAV